MLLLDNYIKSIQSKYNNDIVKTDNIVAGDVIFFKENVFNSNYFMKQIIGERIIKAKVYKCSYGKSNITYSLEVLNCIGDYADDVLRKKYIRKREKTLYGSSNIYRLYWKNEINRCCLTDELIDYRYNASNMELTV